MSNYYMPVCVLSLSFAIFHLVLTNALSGMLFYHLQWLRGEIEKKKNPSDYYFQYLKDIFVVFW